jgi:hypothetical protein
MDIKLGRTEAGIVRIPMITKNLVKKFRNARRFKGETMIYLVYRGLRCPQVPREVIKSTNAVFIICSCQGIEIKK